MSSTKQDIKIQSANQAALIAADATVEEESLAVGE